MNAPQIVQKIWNYCDVLRDEGISYGNYVQQLTYILFLKMADEQTKPPYNKKSIIPKGKDWDSLLSKSGEELETHYRHILESLAKEKGLLGVIYRKSKSEIQDPAKLERLIKLINEETWVGLDVDVKGEIYEGLLQKNAEGTNGAGQYFTPRALIQGIVAVIKPKPMQTIGDTSCGTGGFFLASHDYIDKHYNLDKEQKKFLKQKTFKGWDIVPEVVRLCAMNMYLHGIGDKESQVIQDDSLAKESGDRFDIIMTNPPFGKKSSYKIRSTDGTTAKESMSYARDDFWATSSNKQLNFLQHVKTQLKINGKCAIVVPDNVLFEGNSGETVRRKLLAECDVHTLLRLPTGLFYAQGVKANVLFFDKKPASETNWTKKLWIYDLRTNKHFTLKENNLKFEDMKDFIKCYDADNISERKESERFKAYDYEDLLKRDKTSLDILWIKDESLEDLENLPEPKVIAEEITENLESALDSMKQILTSLNSK
ncbi:MAG: SAM-dependent DNA methyltransferase, partial [Candidatus Nitrosopelagicus sp.]|jgi:type I restriction enzyme M protein|nr:SAM-dependent DNA methyltransferase [Candidatus Nitrosopelagicus sp.]